MSKQLLIENFNVPTKADSVSYDNLPDGVLARVRYPICNVGEKNRNKRKYGTEVWESVMKDAELQEKIHNRACWGHSEHPENGSKTEFISHHVTKFEMSPDKKKVYCEAEVLDTPYGKIVATILRAKCGLGMSTRAEGEVESCTFEDGEKGSNVLAEGFKMDTVDFTADPSTYGALPEKVVLNIVKSVRESLDRNELKPTEARHLLESISAPEAHKLLERITGNRGHAGCSVRLSERDCHKCKGSNTVNDRFERMSKPELKSTWESFIKSPGAMSGSDTLMFQRALARRGVLTESEAFVELAEARKVESARKQTGRLTEAVAKEDLKLLNASRTLALQESALKDAKVKEAARQAALAESRLRASEKARKILSEKVQLFQTALDKAQNECTDKELQAVAQAQTLEESKQTALKEVCDAAAEKVLALEESLAVARATITQLTNSKARALAESAENHKKELVSVYVERIVSSGLRLTEAQRALLSDCTTTAQVDETVRAIRNAIRECAPHLATHLAERAAPPTQVETAVGKVFAGL